ncbi:hypothetical protein HETIRDRAFT_471898 [Heterobasidion irregulare TC 32-1]|uniref:Uncharacterized protein n=1 Tax=Heterobasidion irregulare (strain TC 32-1) TaxID=747525 RepID=W4KCY1_HETIT|nr:uncharacterized protein HETIRDRAFT_471898 [Heterobasidion irregulare TC 32-1]ETW83643.1 hypothetical protein HETIRDRAFT_471898 [Heterobasidion irregulare TC 32-1]
MSKNKYIARASVSAAASVLSFQRIGEAVYKRCINMGASGGKDIIKEGDGKQRARTVPRDSFDDT